MKTQQKGEIKSINRGPVEGMLLIDGRPQIERADMSTLSFDSVGALQQFLAEYNSWN